MLLSLPAPLEGEATDEPPHNMHLLMTRSQPVACARPVARPRLEASPRPEGPRAVAGPPAQNQVAQRQARALQIAWHGEQCCVDSVPQCVRASGST